MPSGLLTFLMAAIILLTLTGCEKDTLLYPETAVENETEYTGNVMCQTFMVYPEGSEFSAFGGSVWLKFPEGAVSVPTEFKIATFPIHHLKYEGFNMYNKGIYLEGEKPFQDLANIMIRLTYDLVPKNWKKSAPGPNDKNLTIYHVSPSIYDYQRINSIGDCCVDCSCTMISGCIRYCGFYVVGEI